jgi:peptidoglycan/LPS O-acetylase OafA/YrhL
MAARPPLPALTGLRFIAAAQVVGFHAHAMVPAWRENPALAFLGAGYSGVSLFFVLSGFVLAYNYLTPDGTGVRSVREFMVARFARVYAVYLVGIVLAFPIFVRDLQRTGGAASVLRDGVPVTAATVTLLQAWIPSYACRLNCPGWSLSSEAFFYLTFPLIGAWLCRRQRGLLVAVCVACWAIAGSIVLTYLRLDPEHIGTITAATQSTWVGMLKFNPLIRLPEFILGIATGLIFLREPGALKRIAAPLSLVTLLAIVALLSQHERMQYLLIHNGVMAPLYAVLIVTLACGVGPLAAILSTKTLGLLGEASFALYLLHVALLVYVVKALGALHLSIDRTPALITVYLVVAQGIAILVLTRIEEPARRFVRRRFGAQKPATSA